MVKQGRAAYVLAVAQGFSTFGGVENQMDVAVFHRVDNMGAPFEHLVYCVARNAIGLEESLSSAGRNDLEAHCRKLLDRPDDPGLVPLLDGYENGSRGRQLLA